MRSGVVLFISSRRRLHIYLHVSDTDFTDAGSSAMGGLLKLDLAQTHKKKGLATLPCNVVKVEKKNRDKGGLEHQPGKRGRRRLEALCYFRVRAHHKLSFVSSGQMHGYASSSSHCSEMTRDRRTRGVVESSGTRHTSGVGWHRTVGAGRAVGRRFIVLNSARKSSSFR